MLGGTVPEHAVREALGGALVDRFLGCELVVRGGGGLRSVLRARAVDQVLTFCDDLARGGDAVMGAAR